MNSHSTPPRSLNPSISRRRFVKTATMAAASSAFAVPQLFSKSKPRPSGNAAAIQNIIVVMMENRSFDHMMGWLPGADGRQAGLTYADSLGQAHPTYPLAPDYQGCGHPDPDHSYEGGRVALNAGACDGWLRAG